MSQKIGYRNHCAIFTCLFFLLDSLHDSRRQLTHPDFDPLVRWGIVARSKAQLRAALRIGLEPWIFVFFWAHEHHLFNSIDVKNCKTKRPTRAARNASFAGSYMEIWCG